MSNTDLGNVFKSRQAAERFADAYAHAGVPSSIEQRGPWWVVTLYFAR